ncbi:unnamed protein product, partial [Effrenium voratum]
VIDDCLQLQPTGCGLGFVAKKDISSNQPLFFETAFCSAPTDGEKEYFYLVAEKAIRKGHADRRASARADVQADFYYDSVLKLSTKDSHDKATLEETEMEADMREQIVMCSIAEANCLHCSEDPGWVALFVKGSRFNHSCSPNAAVESSRSQLLIRAAADIPAGTEA